MQELQLGPRLAFEIENLLGAVVDVDERFALVVLRDELAGSGRDAEAEDTRARIRRREAHAHGCGLAVDRQLHFLRADDAAFVFDVERHRLAGIAGLRDERVDHQRRALERGARAWRRDRSGRPSCSDSRPRPTVKTGTSAAFMASSASESSASVVSAPSLTTTRPGERQTGELLSRAVERGANLRLRAGEGQLGWRRPGAARSTRSGRCRSTNRLDSVFRTSALGPDEVLRRRRRCAACPSTSAICMLRESSTSTPRKFCCGTAAFTTRTGRNRQKRTRSESREPNAGEDDAVPHVAARLASGGRSGS